MNEVEVRTMFPISSEEINRLEIDTVEPGLVCGVVFTPHDIDRAYHRWKSLLESPDPFEHAYTELHQKDLIETIHEYAKQLKKMTLLHEKSSQQGLGYVREISELEQNIRSLESRVIRLSGDSDTLKRLATGRANELAKQKHETANELAKQKHETTEAQKVVQRYQKHHDKKTRHNVLQRLVAWIFRI